MASNSVYACESQPLVLEGLERVFERSGEFVLVGWNPDPTAALERIAELRPVVALIDQSPGWRMVLHFLGELRQVSPDTMGVLCATDLAESDCYRALQAGARGVFRASQSVADLLECLRSVATGKIWMGGAEESPRWAGGRRANIRLTPRERDIVRLVAEGCKNREIAEQLGITAGTVKVHLMHVFEKTGVKDRFHLSARARLLLDEPAGAAAGAEVR